MLQFGLEYHEVEQFAEYDVGQFEGEQCGQGNHNSISNSVACRFQPDLELLVPEEHHQEGYEAHDVDNDEPCQ